MTPPRTQTPPLRLLNGGARPTSSVETLEVISPELALVDPEEGQGPLGLGIRHDHTPDAATKKSMATDEHR